jgi:hypothetical protein
LLATFPIVAVAQEAPDMHALEALMTRFDPMLKEPPPRATYEATFYPERRVKSQETDLGLTQHSFGLSLPVWKSTTDQWSAFARIRLHDLDTSAVLPDTGARLPDELWQIRAGTTYRHRFDNRWIAGGSLSLGSASDKPFDSVEELEAQLSAFVRIPQGERNAWLFSLNYSNNRDFANYFPIPGVGFWYEPSDQLRVLIGFPFVSVDFRPSADLRIEASYAVISNIRARVSYRLGGPLSLYGAFDWSNQRYARAEREDARDRLFYDEKRASAGLRLNLGEHLSLDLAGGYAFDRTYFEGRSTADRDDSRVDVSDTPFASLRLNVRF